MDQTTRTGTPRRDLLKGAAGIAAGAAAYSVLPAGSVAAAPTKDEMALAVEGVGTFPVLSFNWGATSTANIGSVSGGGGAGKASFSELTVEKDVDVFSPELFRLVATGRHAPTASLTIVQKNGLLVRYDLSFVIATSITTTSRDDGTLRDEVGLAFGAISYSVDRSEFGWSVVENRET